MSRGRTVGPVAVASIVTTLLALLWLGVIVFVPGRGFGKGAAVTGATLTFMLIVIVVGLARQSEDWKEMQRRRAERRHRRAQVREHGTVSSSGASHPGAPAPHRAIRTTSDEEPST